MTDKRDELVDAMDLLLTGATYSDGLEALLDVAAALIISSAPDRGAADQTTVAAAKALAERVVAAWDAVRSAAATHEGTDTLQ